MVIYICKQFSTKKSGCIWKLHIQFKNRGRIVFELDVWLKVIFCLFVGLAATTPNGFRLSMEHRKVLAKPLPLTDGTHLEYTGGRQTKAVIWLETAILFFHMPVQKQNR